MKEIGIKEALLMMRRSDSIRRGMAALATISRHAATVDERRAARWTSRQLQKVFDLADELCIELIRTGRDYTVPVQDGQALFPPTNRVQRAVWNVQYSPEFRTLLSFLKEEGQDPKLEVLHLNMLMVLTGLSAVMFTAERSANTAPARGEVQA
jgi:hypothetical protein